MLEKTVECPQCSHNFSVGVSSGFVQDEVEAMFLCRNCGKLFNATVSTKPSKASEYAHAWRIRSPQAYRESQRRYKQSAKAKLARIRRQAAMEGEKR